MRRGEQLMRLDWTICDSKVNNNSYNRKFIGINYVGSTSSKTIQPY